MRIDTRIFRPHAKCCSGTPYAVPPPQNAAKCNTRRRSHQRFFFDAAAPGSTQWRYAYDNRNRLYNVQQWDTSTSTKSLEVQYDYDAEDRRIAKRVYQSGTLTSTEQYGLDGQNAVLTTDAGLNVVGRYLFGPGADQVLGQEVAGHGSNGFQWLISDQEGSVRRVVDASGAVSKSIVYDAFGQRIATSGPGALPRYQYTGQQFDEEDKLGYFDARYYDPSQGRFVNQDPVEDGNNWYDYAGNDPVNNRDASGLSVLNNSSSAPPSSALSKYISGDAFRALVAEPLDWELHKDELSQAQVGQLLQVANNRKATGWLSNPNAYNDAADQLQALYDQLGDAHATASGGGSAQIRQVFEDSAVANIQDPEFIKQGLADAAQGVQNAGVGLLNTGIKAVYYSSPLGQLAQLGIGSAPQISSHDWSRDLYVHEYNNEFSHDNTVGLASIGAQLASGGEIGEIGSLFSRAEVVPELLSEGESLQKTGADLLYDRLGPASESHPEEYADVMTQLREANVPVIPREGTLSFNPGAPGAPGQMILDPDASIGALRHEFQHFTDYRAAGYPGLGPYIEDPEEFISLEARGYDQEIRAAVETGNENLVPAIYKQLFMRTVDLVGKYMGE